MLFILPYILWNAISVAIYGGTFMVIIINSMEGVHDEWSQQTKTKYAFLCLISLGAGEIVGSIINGIIVDRKGQKVANAVFMIEAAIAFSLLLVYAIQYKFTILAYIFPLFWGI